MDPELSAQFDEIRRQLGALAGFPAEVAELRRQLGGLSNRLDEKAVEMRRHFDVTAEALRSDVRAVAGMTATNTEAIAKLRSDVRRDMDERFEIVRLAFVDVRCDIASLRARIPAPRPRPK